MNAQVPIRRGGASQRLGVIIAGLVVIAFGASRIEPYAKDSGLAILAGGARLPISRSGYARLRELLA